MSRRETAVAADGKPTAGEFATGKPATGKPAAAAPTPTADGDNDIASLQRIAFHRERVAARRLAKRDGMPPATALRLILEGTAGGQSVPALIAERLQAQATAVARRTSRIDASRDRFIAKKAETATHPDTWLAWFDGSAVPNPGRLGIGAVLRAPDGKEIAISLAAGAGDGNAAEYMALIAVLEHALSARVARLIVHGDSQIIIGDLLGSAPIRTAALQGYRQTALRLMAGFRSIRLIWIPRAKNGAADRLARAAITLAADASARGAAE